MTNMHRSALILVAVGLGTLLGWTPRSFGDKPQRKIDFAQEVQPILRRHCYRCHGSKNQEASLQLNLRDSAYGEADSAEPIIVKHDAEASLLVQRVSGDEWGDVMPLDGQPLSKREINTLRRWIDQGAAWPDELADARTGTRFRRG